MAKDNKPEKTKSDGATETKERSSAEVWSDARRRRIAAETEYKAAKDAEDAAASVVAEKLITVHKGAHIKFDGRDFRPMKTPARKDKDGTIRTPKYPYRLSANDEPETLSDV